MKDAAAAALFAACKIEDTLKKSKEILCAAYNMKVSQAERLTTDDSVSTLAVSTLSPSLNIFQMFEQHSRSIIGLERLMLEASGFDFRNRYPQRLVLKLCHHAKIPPIVAKTAFNMCLDLYRTFAPLKQTSLTMASASVELACRLHDHPLDSLTSVVPQYERFRISRTEIMETLSDMLDLYTNNKASTLVGPPYAVDRFLNIRITLNQEASSNHIPPYSQPKRANKVENKDKSLTNGVKGGKGKEAAKKAKHSPLSPRDREGKLLDEKTSAGGKPGLKEGTVRFMLSAERARDEEEVVNGYFKMVEEERVVEVPVREGRARRD